MRQILRLIQGSPEWHAHRATPGMFNGSELAAIMGMSSYVTRAELLRRKATGIEPEYDAATLKRFADGHANEAKARPLAEDIIGDDLSAMVMTDTIDGVLLSVSLDGITQGYDTTHEHKSLNIALADALDAGYLPEEYRPQCQAGLMVSGATRCLFMASKDGDPATMRHFWYESDPELGKKIIADCKQFAEDLANYQHTEQTVAPVAAPIEALPALAVTVNGSISLTHNLERFGQRLAAFVQDINTKPQTDQDFVNLDAAVKVLREAETALDAAESNALAQTATIADMCNLVASYRKLARDNRLMFEKIVKQEKDNRRNEIVTQAMHALTEHIAGLNRRIGGNWIPPMHGTRFADAVKGLKSLDSMRDKVAGALANAKIEANEIADRIEANRKVMEQLCDPILFPDFGQVCTKQADDFAALVAMRVTQDEQRKESAKKAEEARIAAAVEAERKAGEARAAAAIEAERMAEAKRVAEAAANDQWGKADAGVGVEIPARAQPEAASTPPLQPDESIVDGYIALLGVSAAEKKVIRAHLVKFEKYRLAREMQAAA